MKEHSALEGDHRSHHRNRRLEPHGPRERPAWLALSLLVAAAPVAGCSSSDSSPGRTGITSEDHKWFPITEGTHAIGRVLSDGPIQCESCHDPAADSFAVFTCFNCHAHPRELTDTLHGTAPVISNYSYTAARCYNCHADGAKVPFVHTGIPTGAGSRCAYCHQPGAAYAALPVTNFDHASITPLPSAGGPDCGSCHVTTSWQGASRVPAGAFDPTRNVLVTALIPTYSGAEITSLTPRSETLTMPMNHEAAAVPASVRQNCAGCHPDAARAVFTNGDFHGSMTALGLPQPTACLECHMTAASMPVGFVGPLATQPARTPASGEMKHDAVVWSGGAPTSMAAVEAECSTCHSPPSVSSTTWSADVSGASPARYHAALTAAGLTEPASCLDCHANSRPNGLLDRTNATIPAGAGWTFDHSARETKAECTTCHQASIDGRYAAWSGGKYHLAGSATPAACLPCHEGDRPTSTSAWHSTTYRDSPFDYVTNARGVTHGDAQDCALCHAGPGTGAWGGTQNWQGGHFSHGPTTPAAATCRDCHTTQRPDLQPGTTPSEMARLLGGFDHATAGTGECKGCHLATVTAGNYVHYFNPATGTLPGGDWQGAQNTPSDAFDPQQTITVDAQIPTYSGTTITRVTPQVERLNMHMDHGTSALPASVIAVCADCHTGAATGDYYPGNLHTSLADHGISQPATCNDCHLAAMPTGFVGPLATDPARTPASGEMKHDAVEWMGSSPTSVAVVTADCAVCHLSPGAQPSTWATSTTRTTPARYHDALAAAGAHPPRSCLDCHANSRPTTQLTSANSALPAGLRFDHTTPDAMVDCTSCHGVSSSPYSAWSGGKYHLTGSRTPSTCLPCHEGERPTSTAGWTSPGYQGSPFDYVTNAQGHTHGDGRDCASCHTGPGTNGAWGGTQTWTGGHFTHGAGTPSERTCIACHMTQRPDLQPGTTAQAMAALLGFDHAANGTGDCIACHQATVRAGTYVHYTNPVTHALPNGDWAGGQSYPGSTLASSPTQTITVSEITLLRSGPNNLVYGMSTISATFHDAMLHTSAAVPAEVSPGPADSPNQDSCWHCHENNAGTVTSYANGRFHSALMSYSATPGGPTSALPQPTSHCGDCHAQMRPSGIVERASSNLRPMDHGALFSAPVTIGGVRVIGAADMDCSVCHSSVVDWTDGQFHPRIGAAVPVDCTGCHYPLMADAGAADLTSGTSYAMRHASAEITNQNCITCHTTALTASATSNAAASAWHPGAFHPNVARQPGTCNTCHAVSVPSAATQSSVSYTFSLGGTATNGGQWMSHASSSVVGRDCAVCHAADARTNGSAWSNGAPFHASVPNVSTCQECHGLRNGGGTTAGTRNNLPAGLTNASMVSTAASNPATGVPAGTHAQISHADVNVTAADCNFCHTQVGPSSAPGVRGAEWAQATFHVNFTGAHALVMNGGTGRCSHCHMNVRPGPSFTALDHSGFTATSAQDCVACHGLPGTGTLAAPNWLGAVPQYISVGGFNVPQPPATGPTVQVGITNLPHPAPAGSTCTDCHRNGGGRNAIGYDHASALINNNCNSCHEAGSDLVGTPWNGVTNETAGAGDTRPFTLSSVTATFDGDTRNVTWPNHFYPVDCKECHIVPTGFGHVTTGTAYRTTTGAWGNGRAVSRSNFPHNERVMTRPSTCLMCHNPIPD